MAKKFVLTAELKVQSPQNIDSVVNQINSRLKDVKINFQLQNAARSIKDLDNISRSSDKAAESVTKMGNAFGISLKRFAAFSIASRAIGLFSNRISGAIEKAIDFQNEVVRLSQITGQSISDLKGLTDQIGQLATTLGVSSDKIVSVTDILAQAGLQADDLRVAINTLAKTELAPTFGKIQDTAEGAVAILAQFGEGVGALERQLGAINKVSAKFAVESEDLISVVRRTGGVFKASGGSLEELLALFTSVRATTRESAESIATGLRTIFTRLQRPQTIEYLKQLGVELTDINGKFVGPFEATKRLSQALSALGEGDVRFIQIAEELGGYRQIGKVIPLLRQFELSEKALQAAQEGRTSLDEDVATSQQSLQRQFIKTQEAFLKLVRDISETSSFQILIKTSLNFANALIKIADSIKPLLPLIAAFAAIKFTQNIGGFFAGLGAGFKKVVGPQAKASGGKIMAFARGGLVPGTGNGDTVPAMLSPGEFVIRKSSVNKIGAENLAAMNENRYENGGEIPIKDLIGKKPSLKRKYDSTKDKDLFEEIDIKRIKASGDYFNYRLRAASIVDGATKKKNAYEANEYIRKEIGINANDENDINIDNIKDSTLKRWKKIKQENPRKLPYEINWKQSPNKIQGALLEKDIYKKYNKIEKLPNEAGADFWFGENKFIEAKNKLEPTDDDELKAKALLGYAYKTGNKKNDELDIVPKLSINLISTNPKDKFFGGYIRKYALGTEGKGVTPLSLDENLVALGQRWGISIEDMQEIKSLGPAKLAELISYKGPRTPFDVRSSKKFNGNLAKQALAKSRETLKQKAATKESLPQYGVAVLKKRNNFNLEQSDGAGRNFILRSVYMGKDDAKRIQNLVAKSGAERLINRVANYMTSAVGENKASFTGQIPNLSAITGSIFEAALRRVDNSVDDSDPDKLTFDFPSGLGPEATKVFGVDSSVLAGIKTDAKFSSSDDARKSIQRKVRKDLDEQLVPRPQKTQAAAPTIGKKVKVTNNPKRANSGGGIQTAKNTSEKQIIRNVGYIDSDVLNSPENKAIVEQEIEKLQAQGIKIEGGYRGYKKYLNDLAIKARKSNSVNKLTNIVGMAGSGKSTLMLGNQASDNASLRKTNRFPIIKPEDIAKASSVINVTASLDQKDVEEEMNYGDRTVVLSSSTKQEQDLLRKRRKKRDQEISQGTSATGFGRSSGSTKNAPVDSAYFEALLQSGMTDPKKLLTLGITEKGFRRKKKAELPKVLEEKINLYYGNFGPASKGHELARQEGLKQSIGAKSLVAVGIDSPIKQGDEHSYRSALLSQKERVAMAQKVFKDSYVAKATKEQYGFSLPSLYDVGTSESGQRTFIKPAKGSTATVGDEKDEKSLAKYKKAGLDVVTLPRIEGISGTKLREAIMSNNMEEFKNLTTAEGFDFLKDKTSIIKNRADILPKIMEKVSAKSKRKLSDIESELAKYPARLSKTTPEDVREKVEELRKQRDKIKASAETRPLRIMERLKSLYPDKYRFNSGGQAPSDTVPALLTPGEFVINKESAQAIGYGNLNRMNKRGVAGFAKGGPVAVQKFANGTSGTGVESPRKKSDGFSLLSDKGFLAANAFSALTATLGDTESAFGRVINYFGTLGVTISSLTTLFNALGGAQLLTQLPKIDIKKIFTTGKGGLGDIIGGFRRDSSGKTSRVSGESFAEGLQGFGDRSKRLQEIKQLRSRRADILQKYSGGADLTKSSNRKIARKKMAELASSEAGTAGRATAIREQGEIEKLADLRRTTRGPRGLRRGTSLTAKAGEFVGKTAANLSSRGGIQGVLGKGIGLAGRGIAGLGAGALGGTAASLAAFSGPIAIATTALTVLNGALEAGIDAQGKYNTAIEKGDTANAQYYASLKEAPGIFQALDSVVNVFGTRLSIASDTFNALNAIVGGPTLIAIKEGAKSQALLSKLNSEQAKIQERLNSTLEKVESGETTATSALQQTGLNSVNAGRELSTQALASSLAASKAEFGNKSGFVGGALRGTVRVATLGLAGLAGLESGGQRNQRIDKENVAKTKEAVATNRAEFEKLIPLLTQSARETFVSGGTKEDFIRSSGAQRLNPQAQKRLESLQKQNEAAAKGGTALTAEQTVELEALESANSQFKKVESIANQIAKSVEENRKYLEALNFGFRNISSAAQATSLSLDILNSSVESGYNSFENANKTLEAAITSIGSSLNPKDVENSLNTLQKTFQSFGASEEQISQVTSSFKSLNIAQTSAQTVLENIKTQSIKKGTTLPPEQLKQEFQTQLGSQLRGQGVNDNEIRRIQGALGKIEFDSDAIQKIQSGDLSDFVGEVFDPLRKAFSDQAISIVNERKKQEDQLIALTRQRIELEKSAIESRKQAIDIELEAKKAVEEFGGPALKSAEKLDALNKKLNLDLGAAGAQNVATGSSAELKAVQAQLKTSFSALQGRQNASIASGGVGAFANAAGLSEDKRKQLEDAQQSLIEYSRQRLDLIREEIDIAKKKNALEKSSFEKLLSGDIQGAIEEQAAAGAQKLLEAGDVDLARSLGPKAILGALKNLEGIQGIGTDTKQKAARTAALSVGANISSADAFADATPEIKNLQAQGRDIAGVLSEAGTTMADLQQMKVNAQQVVIQAQEIKMGAAANTNPMGSNLTQNPKQFYKGGTVYANRGMFIPRGTDTVPAMLTPGEFVVNARAAKQNAGLLSAINGGAQALSRGGVVYASNGGALRTIADFIPFLGSGLDLGEGVLDLFSGNISGGLGKIAMGGGGLLLDFLTGGSASLIKGGVKSLAKLGLKGFAKGGMKGSMKGLLDKLPKTGAIGGLLGKTKGMFDMGKSGLEKVKNFPGKNRFVLDNLLRFSPAIETISRGKDKVMGGINSIKKSPIVQDFKAGKAGEFFGGATNKTLNFANKMAGSSRLDATGNFAKFAGGFNDTGSVRGLAQGFSNNIASASRSDLITGAGTSYLLKKGLGLSPDRNKVDAMADYNSIFQPQFSQPVPNISDMPQSDPISMPRNVSNGMGSNPLPAIRREAGAVPSNNVASGGFSSGGIGIPPEAIKTFSSSIDNFVAAIDKLQNMQLNVKFDPTSINVNISGGSFLEKFSEGAQREIMKLASKEIEKYKVGGQDGKLTKGSL